MASTDLSFSEPPQGQTSEVGFSPLGVQLVDLSSWSVEQQEHYCSHLRTLNAITDFYLREVQGEKRTSQLSLKARNRKVQKLL